MVRIGGKEKMDSFMDKIAQKFTAQDMIKANTAAEEKEMERLRKQVAEYDERLNELRRLNQENLVTAEQLRKLVTQGQDQGALFTTTVHTMGAPGTETLSRDIQELRQALSSQMQDMRELQEVLENQQDGMQGVRQLLTGQTQDMRELQETIDGQAQNILALRQAVGQPQTQSQPQDNEELKEALSKQLNDIGELKEAAEQQAESLQTLRQVLSAQSQNLMQEIRQALASQQDSQGTKELQGLQGYMEEQAQNVKKLQEMLSAQNGRLNEISDRLMEHIHREDVKVYRNVQAAVGEENKTMVSTLGDKFKSIKTMLLVTLLVSLANIAMWVLSILGVF